MQEAGTLVVGKRDVIRHRLLEEISRTADVPELVGNVCLNKEICLRTPPLPGGGGGGGGGVKVRRSDVGRTAEGHGTGKDVVPPPPSLHSLQVGRQGQPASEPRSRTPLLESSLLAHSSQSQEALGLSSAGVCGKESSSGEDFTSEC